MRCISAAAVADAPLPERARLESVRHLGRRFPQARLREVPIVRAGELDLRADPEGATRVWLALETLQVTGSFKVRGALVALDSRRGEPLRVVAASAGNHGAAMAYAGNVLDVPVTVCVPRTAPRAKRERITHYGAELVVVASDHYDDAEALAKKLAVTRGATFVSPYDDLDVILGNGVSLGFEIARGLAGVPERLLAPFGGGGLATGLAWAMRVESGDSWARCVWGVQSEASCAMAMSLERGSAVERLETGGTTLAEGLEGGISADAFARARAAVAGVLVAAETQVAQTMAYAHRSMGLVLEGSAATALVPVLFGLPEALRGGDLLVVLTGRNVDPERLDALQLPGA
jgi:threonine dehydratase